MLRPTVLSLSQIWTTVRLHLLDGEFAALLDSVSFTCRDASSDIFSRSQVDDTHSEDPQ